MDIKEEIVQGFLHCYIHIVTNFHASHVEPNSVPPQMIIFCVLLATVFSFWAAPLEWFVWVLCCRCVQIQIICFQFFLPQYVSFSFGDLVLHRHCFPTLCFRCVTYTYFNVLCILEQVFHFVKYS